MPQLAKVAASSLYAPAPSTTRGEATPLAATPKGDFLVYGAGKHVVIRSVADPLQATLYAQHQSAVTAVAVSPNGEWIASGDERGTVRVWARQPEQTLKLETAALGGKVLDLAWSGDGQRLCAVGEGRDSFGKVFTWDSGNTLGCIDGHSKRIISCAFRPSRPFRIATGSDDLAVNWYEGPPFKFKAALREHARYPNCVRFSPDGALLVSAGADAKLVKYDGATGTKLGELGGDDPHRGAIYACAWSPDSARLATASADKTVKVWGVGSGLPERTIAMSAAPQVADMQVGCCWKGPTLAALSLSGRINLFDPASGAVVSTLMGHSKGITALAVDARAGGVRFASASFDGMLALWDARDGSCTPIGGKGHESGVVALALLPGDVLASAAVDRSVRFSCLGGAEYDEPAAVQLGSSACHLCAVGEQRLVAVLTEGALCLVAPGELVAQLELGFRASCVACSPCGSELAVGGCEGELHLFALSPSAPRLVALPGGAKRHQGAVTSLAYSPAGTHLASCGADRHVYAFALPALAPVSTSWTAHKAKVLSLAWAPSGRLLASGGVDSSIVLWSIDQPGENVVTRLAHADGVTAVGFLSDELIISAGQDACIKTWAITQ